MVVCYGCRQYTVFGVLTFRPRKSSTKRVIQFSSCTLALNDSLEFRTNISIQREVKGTLARSQKRSSNFLNEGLTSVT